MKKNMKVLVFTTTFPTFLEGDSTPSFVYELSRRLAEKGNFRLAVLAPFRKGTKVFEEKDGLKIYRFKYGFTSLCEGAILPNLKKNTFLFFQLPFLFFFALVNLAKIVEKEKIDIIHAHWIILQGFIAVFYKKLFRKKNLKIICTAHGGDIFGLQNLLMKKIKKWTLNNIDKLTVVSNAIKDEVKKLNVRDDLLIEVISMGVDTELFNPNKYDPEIKEKYNIEGPFLLFVGRLAPEKGANYLINAMPKVLDKNPKAKLMIIGSGTLKEELINRAKELKIEKSIIFTGWIDNKKLPKYYATADVFVCPSLREGFPVSYLEALSCGTPIIVGDLPVSREIVKGKNGLIIKQKDSEDISDKINLFLSKRNFGGRSLHHFVKENYDWEIISQKYLEVLI